MQGTMSDRMMSTMDMGSMPRMAMMMPGMMGGAMGAGMMTPGGMGMMMVPRCEMRFERCPGGMKITCTTADATAMAMMQNLMGMMQGGTTSCCMMMNGLCVMCCNMTMGACTCEMTDAGCTITCTSGDKHAMAMIQACCDCMNSMTASGCVCCVTMNGMPMCCGV